MSRSTGRMSLVVVSLFLLPALLLAGLLPQEATHAAPVQEPEAKNPLAGNQEAIREGQHTFRVFCAFCHGFDARGGSRGPDLTSARSPRSETDAAMLRTIMQGVPGTEMPPNDVSEQEAWGVIAYLRSLGAGVAGRVAGDPEAGRKVFYEESNCSLCHMVNGRGGRLGPDLSRVGAKRPPRYLAEKIRNPNRLPPSVSANWLTGGFGPSYEKVVVVTERGERLTGALRNEDSFTLQLMDLSEQLHLLSKKDLRQVVHERESLMAPYEGLLTEKQLEDLVAYLASQRPRQE